MSSWTEAARDLVHLLRFRAATVRRPRGAVAAVVVVLGLTVLLAVVPARAHVPAVHAERLADLLPAGFLGFLLLAVGASMGGGGGRELLPRDQLVVHPVSPVTEHLGALALAPLNLAWLVQAWTLLGATAVVVGPDRLLGSQLVVVLWLLAATALAQAVGWLVEGVRRTAHGVAVVRVATVAAGLALAGLQLAGVLGDAVAAAPTARLVDSLGTEGWRVAAAVLAAVLVVAVVAGGAPARWALHLPPREELRVESGVHEARHLPRPWLLPDDLALLRRLDRGSVWRSVGMRRGLTVLALGPGLVALVGGMGWDQVLVLPGLAASGAALLFGVNAWCLDGRGAVWRETLPVGPATVFAARSLVVAECLAVVSAVTVVLASLRNGLPPAGTGAALVACWLVVVVQVLAISMSWSVRRPYAVDLRSPRATPAPPAVMLGYASRLSLVTTLTGLFFSGLGAVAAWWVTALFAAPFLAWSSVRWWRARRRWLSDGDRAVIALTVAA